MNLLIFTPAIKKSAIGRMAALVTHDLIAQGHQVTIVRTEAKHLLSSEIHDFNTTTLFWHNLEKLPYIIQAADLCLYQIGDNFEYHEGGLYWLPRLPGLVCLHDFYVGCLFWGWGQSRCLEAQSILQLWYGKAVADTFFNFSNNESFLAGTHDVSPMTEWICAMALGVITHSSWGCERVLRSCSGPVRVVPLAYNAPNTKDDRQSCKNGNLQVLTIGHINGNKRVASVISAIASSNLLKQSITYRLIGNILPEAALFLSVLAKNLGVSLVISGEVDDQTLALALSSCDIVSCLRWPSLEAASASTIEAMLYGKPVIVTDTGFYAEIPNGYVLKVSPNNEIDDIRMALVRLLEDKNLRQSIGAQAKEWASKTFTAANYAAEVIQIAAEINQARPTINALNYFSDLIYRWCDGTTDALDHNLTLSPLNIFDTSTPKT